MHRKTEENSTCLSYAFPIQCFNRDRRCRTAAEVVHVLRKATWKIAAAVLAVVIAGIVYCVFFAEEKTGTVQYQTGEETKAVTAAENVALSDVAENKNGQDSESGLNRENGLKQEQTDGEVQGKRQQLIYVHICGAVKKPAVYSLPEGARVCDAIATAGGFTEEAADDYVNQARFLSDGERVYIPEKGELSNLSAAQYAAGQTVSGNSGSQSTGSVQNGNQEQLPVNINTATLSELMNLPGIGESRAESIIAYREKHGAFSTIEDIMQISGIKDAAYEKIKDRICTGNE